MISTPTPSWSILAGGCQASGGRAPQVKYTYQGPYGTVFTAGLSTRSPGCGPSSVRSISIPFGADHRSLHGDRQYRGQPAGDHGLPPSTAFLTR